MSVMKGAQKCSQCHERLGKEVHWIHTISKISEQIEFCINASSILIGWFLNKYVERRTTYQTIMMS